jgi:hypothetical protein
VVGDDGNRRGQDADAKEQAQQFSCHLRPPHLF